MIESAVASQASWDKIEVVDGVSIGHGRRNPESPGIMLVGGLRSKVGSQALLGQALFDLGYDVAEVDITKSNRFGDRRVANVSEFAIELAQAKRHIFGDKAVTIEGHSHGGKVAQASALAFPDDYSRLIAHSTLPGAAFWPISTRVMRVMSQPRRTEREVGNLYGGAIRRDPTLATRLGITQELVTVEDKISYERQLNTFYSSFAMPLFLHTMQPETLVIADTDDPIVPAINGRVITNLINGSLFPYLAPNPLLSRLKANLVITDDWGHMSPMTHPGQTAEIIDQFVKHSINRDILGEMERQN